jgi:hypothetical protein
MVGREQQQGFTTGSIPVPLGFLREFLKSKNDDG